MQITITNSDLQLMINNHLKAMGIVTEGAEVSYKIKAGRKSNDNNEVVVNIIKTTATKVSTLPIEEEEDEVVAVVTTPTASLFG